MFLEKVKLHSEVSETISIEDKKVEVMFWTLKLLYAIE